MKKIATVKAILKVFLPVLGCIGLQLGSPQSAMAEDTIGTLPCSNATLNGTYLFGYIGWQVQGNGNNSQPVAYAGQETYNGTGTVRGINSISVNGSITRNEPYTGTYTVHPDCTGTLVENVGNVPIHFDLFIAPSGDEFVFLETDPGTVFASNESRVAHRVH